MWTIENWTLDTVPLRTKIYFFISVCIYCIISFSYFMVFILLINHSHINRPFILTPLPPPLRTWQPNGFFFFFKLIFCSTNHDCHHFFVLHFLSKQPLERWNTELAATRARGYIKNCSLSTNNKLTSVCPANAIFIQNKQNGSFDFITSSVYFQAAHRIRVIRNQSRASHWSESRDVRVRHSVGNNWMHWSVHSVEPIIPMCTPEKN